MRNDYLFPDALEHLYGVHTVHGYSALAPRSIYALGLAKQPEYGVKLADYTALNGELLTNGLTSPARFQWLGLSKRTVRVEQVSLNELRVSLGPGPAGTLLWTDTRYPGWRGTMDGAATRLEPEPPCFTRIAIPAKATTLALVYRPRFLSVSGWLALIGCAGVALAAVWPRLPGWMMPEADLRSRLAPAPP